MPEFEISSNHSAAGDEYQAASDDAGALVTQQGHPLDGDGARTTLRKLLSWYYYEREKQAANRLEMATDHDFYDNLQWDEDDKQTLLDRGQLPLVFNEIAPMVDWLIGTERRTRVDWKVLPRTEDDVQIADIKTQVLKYVSDINRVQFLRSRAFADAVKGGIGWMDDGVRDDPTQDVLYSKYEDWRNILYDSASYELDLSDARYIFRWRWVDEDIAVMMFPDRENCIRRAVESRNHANWSAEDEVEFPMSDSASSSGAVYAQGTGMMVDVKRRRVRLFECQYREPVRTKVVASGPMKGSYFNEGDDALVQALNQQGGSIIDKVTMRVHIAVFTESDVLSMGPSVFRHNRFTLTPIWCYRRNRDRMPYGVVRRVRDLQRDLNKRASKALFMLNTNQIIAEEGAVADWDVAADEASRPDGVIIKRQGKEFAIRRDTDGATGQIQMMTLDAQSIQKSAGVSQENMGRQTNAVSGEAIKARQLQGSVVTTEPFDNLRLAVQVQGEKQNSLVEQFYSEEKVIRLTGQKGAIEWLRVNQPERQPDGSVRYLNDITASASDFVVSEQDYSGTLRAAMFESLSNVAQRLPPEVALRLLTMAFEYSDLPNKDEVADQIRKLTGERDETKPMTPEEQAQFQQMQAQQAQQMQMQQEMAMAALEEQRAKIREINARAMKLEAEAGGDGGAASGMASQVQAQAAQEIERLTDELRRAQAELQSQAMKVRTDADTRIEAARIDAESRTRVAEIKAASDERIAQMQVKLDRVDKQEGGKDA